MRYLDAVTNGELPAADTEHAAIRASDEAAKRAIGRRVRARRKLLKLSASEIAARVGQGEHTMLKIEQGENVVQWLQLARWARALETTPNDLLGFPKDVQASTPLSEAAIAGILTVLLPVFDARPETAPELARALTKAYLARLSYLSAAAAA